MILSVYILMSFDFPFGKLFGNLLLPLFGSKFEFFFLQKYGAAAILFFCTAIKTSHQPKFGGGGVV
jgi:hypothetical protein